MAGMINGISYVMAPVPGLTQDDSHVSYCNGDNLPKSCNGSPICHCPHLIELEHCKVYELMVRDQRSKFKNNVKNIEFILQYSIKYDISDLIGTTGSMTHPIHFHGYAFQVVDMGNIHQFESGRGYFANATHLPVVKDTVAIPCAGFVRLRFRACNPGYWFIHCHFEFHAHSGLRAVIKVGDRKDMPPPPPNFPKCDNFLSPVEEFDQHSAGTTIHYRSVKFGIFTFSLIILFELVVLGILRRV